ncbi:ferritin [bacterium]|jgi:bacterioferritin|nr:ferritin [bacterium]
MCCAANKNKELIKLLQRAYSEELLASYQYWLGAQVAEGACLDETKSELLEHYEEEFEHAKLLSDKIIALGGSPVITPREWYDHAPEGFAAPSDPQTKTLLEQNIKGEQGAIGFYNEILEFLGECDCSTYKMIEQIRNDEIKHEEDLTGILNKL